MQSAFIQNSNRYLNKNNNISFKEIAFLWQCVVVPAIQTINIPTTTVSTGRARRGPGGRDADNNDFSGWVWRYDFKYTIQPINTKFLTGDWTELVQIRGD